MVSSGSRERAFVGKVSPNGTVRWLQVVSQDPNDSAKSRFRACQLTPDGTKFMVSGYMQFSRSSSDPTITFGEKNYTQKGYADGLIAHLNPADGKVQHLIGVGVPGGTGYMNSFDRFAKGPSGTVMYLLKQGYHGGVWSDGGSNVDCSDASPGGCMIVVKYTGTTRNWVTEIWNDDDWQGGIALTSDGAKVIAGTVSAEVRVLDSSTGAILVNKTISGMEAVRSITTIGSDIYVLGNTYGTMSVDSITHSGLPDVTYTSLIRLTLSGNTLTANKAIWMGGNESTGVDTMFISKAYGSAGGTANRLLVGINLLGSTFMAGNGYKKVFGNTPAVGYWYGVGCCRFDESWKRIKLTSRTAQSRD